jgi:hypothetical protein
LSANQTRDEFTVTVPSALKVARSEVIDFVRYAYYRDDVKHPILAAYEGTPPNFESKKGVSIRQVEINGLSARDMRWKGPGQRINRRVLIALPVTAVRQSHRFVHFAYVKLKPDDAAIADAMIQSIVPTP